MKTKQIIWAHHMDGDKFGALIHPLLKDQQVFYHSKDLLFSLDIDNGKKNWELTIPCINSPKIFDLVDELIIMHRTFRINPDLGVEAKDEILGINFDGEIVWSLPLSNRISGERYWKDGNTLWLLDSSHVENENQSLYCINLQTGIIEKTLEIPSAATNLKLVNDNFIFHNHKPIANSNTLGLYLTDKNGVLIKTLEEDRSVANVFLFDNKVIYTTRKKKERVLRIIDMDTLEPTHQQDIYLTSICFDNGIIYFLEKKENLYLYAMTVDLEIKWRLEMPRKIISLKKSNQYIYLTGTLKNMIVSKNKGEIVHEFERNSLITPVDEHIYVKERDQFLKLRLI